MNEKKKAIGYVCGIPVTGTDLCIGKEYQKVRLITYAKRENIELVHIFEDDDVTKAFIDRPGVQELLLRAHDYDTVLVERVWVLTKKRKELMPFLEKIEHTGTKLVATACLWDYLSQMLRRRYGDKLAAQRAEVERTMRYHILKMTATHTERLIA